MNKADVINQEQLMDGDLSFIGVNELRQPSDLQPGETSSSKNARYTNSEIEPRLGVAKLPWINLVSSLSDYPLPFLDIYGVSEYRDGNGNNWAIIAADGYVYKTRESFGASKVKLPVGIEITYEVTFTQTQNGMVMFRGDNGDPLYMKDLDSGFVNVVLEENTRLGEGTENPPDSTMDAMTEVDASGNGLQAIPNASSGEWINNRLFIPYSTETEKDLLAISDYLNATRYKGVFSQARINQGSSDTLNRFFKFSETTGIAFKDQSIYALYNLQDDLSSMILDEVTREMGCVAPRAVTQIGDIEGGQVWFLSDKLGIHAINYGQFGKLQVTQVPVSNELDATIKRIDWSNASKARSAFWDNKYYLAVPLDDSIGYGPEIVRDLTYTAGTKIIYVIEGEKYQWVKGDNDTSLSNGITTVAESGIFTAQTYQVALNGTGSSAVTASLKRVYEDTNNAILVYDFKRGKWAGYDTGSALMVKEFQKLQYAGQTRLFFFSADGFINLMENMYFDEVLYESVPAVTTDTFTGSYALAAQVGFIYRVQCSGGYTFSVVNGDQTIDAADGEYVSFVAQTTDVVITSGIDVPIVIIGPVSWLYDQEQIDFDVISRGYMAGLLTRKTWEATAVQLSTWNPSYSIKTMVEGVEESASVVDDRTKSRITYYRPFNKAPWDETNTDDDHATKYRQDYSLILNEDTVASGDIEAGIVYFVESDDVTSACQITYNSVAYTNQSTFTGVAGVTTYSVDSGSPLVYPPGSYVFIGENGINPDLLQEITEQLNLPQSRGRYIQMRIQSNQGRVRVKSILVSGHADDQILTGYA